MLQPLNHYPASALPGVSEQRKLASGCEMLRNVYLIVSGGLMLLAPIFLFPSDTKAGCEALVAKYNGQFPGPDDPMRDRFVDCYYVICGVRLNLDP